MQKRICGEILHLNNVQKLRESLTLCYPFYYIIRNIRPVCHQVYQLQLLFFFVCVCMYKFVLETESLLSVRFVPLFLQDLVGLIISVLLLGDFSLVLLLLLQLYSISMLVVFLVLFIPPLGIVLPFPTGINALFSHGPRRSAGLARVYALWNLTSVINVVSRTHALLAIQVNFYNA